MQMAGFKPAILAYIFDLIEIIVSPQRGSCSEKTYRQSIPTPGLFQSSIWSMMSSSDRK